MSRVIRKLLGYRDEDFARKGKMEVALFATVGCCFFLAALAGTYFVKAHMEPSLLSLEEAELRIISQVDSEQVRKALVETSKRNLEVELKLTNLLYHFVKQTGRLPK